MNVPVSLIAIIVTTITIIVLPQESSAFMMKSTEPLSSSILRHDGHRCKTTITRTFKTSPSSSSLRVPTTTTTMASASALTLALSAYGSRTSDDMGLRIEVAQQHCCFIPGPSTSRHRPPSAATFRGNRIGDLVSSCTSPHMASETREERGGDHEHGVQNQVLVR